jgi:hypothetical protein
VPPPGADNVSTVDADVDGDGRPERAALWSQPDGARRAWRLGVAGPGDAAVVAAVDEPSTFDPASPWTAPAVLGAADADGTGGDELFVATGHSSYSQDVQIWGLRDCALVATALGGAAPATFAVGASAREKVGVTCAYTDDSASLTTWRAVAADEPADAFTVTTTDHTWTGPLALRADPARTRAPPARDEWTLLEAGGLRCGRPPFTLVDRAVAGSSAAEAASVVPVGPAFTG